MSQYSSKEVTHIVTEAIAREQRRQLRLMRKVLQRLESLLSEANGHCPVTAAVRREVIKLSRMG